MFKDFPEEMEELFRLIDPYLDGAALREDAPKEAFEALEKLRKLALELGQ